MGYFNRIFNSCNETCILSLRSKEEKISFKQRVEMKVHFRFCKCCQNFQTQSNKIDDAMKAFFKDIGSSPLIKASEHFKTTIRERLK